MEQMVTYKQTSVLYECVAESQSQGGLGALAYASPSDFLHLAAWSLVCASARSDASMAALVRAAAAEHAGGAPMKQPRDGTRAHETCGCGPVYLTGVCVVTRERVL